MNTKNTSGADISDWRPEDEKFWKSTGKKIAYRNLWISIPALLCGFAVWGMWGIITVQMLNLGFPFTQAELFTLTAIAGISGATMRIPASFLIRLAGTPTYIQNAGFAWVLSLVPLSVLCWFGMSNLKTVSPDTGSTLAAFAKVTYLYTLAFIPSIVMLYLYLPAPTGLGLLNMWVAIPLDIVAALAVMRLAAFGTMKENVAKQFAIFSNKHTWSMTALYVVTFGSFIGFSMALPLAITVIFGFQHIPDAAGVMQHALKNPNAPSALTYAWMGPFIGAAVRPVGGWISDKLGGSIVTQWVSVVMVAASAAVGYVMMLAYQSATPEQYFFVFMALFIVLFAATGVGNGSTFRSVGFIFDRTQAGPVLGWTSAVAAYGAFIAPVVIGAQIKAGTPQNAMYGFAIFYALCLVLNWWFYLRAGAEIKNP
jgi:NNP family nitrate/nitrite transporter-like MFS transporter